MASNIVIIIIAVLGVSMAHVYFEDRHKYRVDIDLKNLEDIPTHFDVKGPNALAIFKKYVTNIQELAQKDNVTVTYKVKVNKENNKRKTKKGKQKKSKKFNVPLKKKNMKLSSFEIELRRHVNDNNIRKISEVLNVTTEINNVVVHTTKQSGTGKYKPIINGIKTKYTKFVKPVRSKLITLN